MQGRSHWFIQPSRLFGVFHSTDKVTTAQGISVGSPRVASIQLVFPTALLSTANVQRQKKIQKERQKLRMQDQVLYDSSYLKS